MRIFFFLHMAAAAVLLALAGQMHAQIRTNPYEIPREADIFLPAEKKAIASMFDHIKRTESLCKTASIKTLQVHGGSIGSRTRHYSVSCGRYLGRMYFTTKRVCGLGKKYCI